ncbi:MAG: hypothetical protein C0391_05485 [Anaerolinea sp.]|nr:hypothetical protein [Anaerolinea sp.]
MFLSGGLVAIILTSSALMFFPLPMMPYPSGPYPVGTREYTLDPSTCQDTVNNYNNYRVRVKIWYPAERTKDKANYAINKDEVIRFLKFYENTTYDLMNYAYAYTNSIKSNSYNDADINRGGGGSFPVILYNGAYFSVVGQNSILMEELASHGFIVLSIAHPYGTIITYEDSSFITPETKLINDTFNLAFAETLPLDQQYEDWLDSGMNIVDADHKYYNQLSSWKSIINQWETDNYCVLEYFIDQNTNNASIFFEKINFNSIGVIGHSLGGYTAGNLCSHQAAVKACVFLDTNSRSDYFFTDMQKPSLFIFANSSVKIDPYIEKNPDAPISVVIIEDVHHLNFMEQWLLVPYNFNNHTYTLFNTYRTLYKAYGETTMFFLSTMPTNE